MAEQKTGSMVFSIVEGGEFVATFPHPLTMETVDELEQQLAIVIRGLRRTALQQQAKADAEAEYLSWVPASSVDVSGAGAVQAPIFWCHEESHDRPRCQQQCAECSEYDAPIADGVKEGANG
jgi:hypothetical protein